MSQYLYLNTHYYKNRQSCSRKPLSVPKQDLSIPSGYYGVVLSSSFIKFPIPEIVPQQVCEVLMV